MMDARDTYPALQKPIGRSSVCRLHVCLLCACFVHCCILQWAWAANVAHAQTDATDESVAEARERFDVGTTLYRTGRFLEAAAEFLRAYELSNEPDLLHNVYLAYRDAGERAQAAQMLRRYLDEAPGIAPDVRALLTHRAEAMERAAATHTEGPTASTPTEEPPADAEAADEQAAPQALHDPPGESEPAAPTPSRDPPWGTVASLSIAGLGLLGAAVAGPLALTRRDELAATCAPSCTEQEAESVRTLGILTDVSLGIAAAGAIAGLVLFFVETSASDTDHPSDQESLSLAPAVDDEVVALHVTGRF